MKRGAGIGVFVAEKTWRELLLEAQIRAMKRVVEIVTAVVFHECADP